MSGEGRGVDAVVQHVVAFHHLDMMVPGHRHAIILRSFVPIKSQGLLGRMQKVVDVSLDILHPFASGYIATWHPATSQVREYFDTEVAMRESSIVALNEPDFSIVKVCDDPATGAGPLSRQHWLSSWPPFCAATGRFCAWKE